MSMLKDSIRESLTLGQMNKMQQKIENINLDALGTQEVDTLKIKY
jgi:AsmA protein